MELAFSTVDDFEVKYQPTSRFFCTTILFRTWIWVCKRRREHLRLLIYSFYFRSRDTQRASIQWFPPDAHSGPGLHWAEVKLLETQPRSPKWTAGTCCASWEDWKQEAGIGSSLAPPRHSRPQKPQLQCCAQMCAPPSDLAGCCDRNWKSCFCELSAGEPRCLL